ncbi:mucin-7 [Phoca vitulina]|uniref:mucin-7 n=1 Tax=Phoca vitulina TaxID=9720 RepID=UPI0013963F1A|nr:mucin-7 [Phoca vitulina]
MKTLTLLACVCALSACFSVSLAFSFFPQLSEGRKKPWKTQHKNNYVQQHILDRRLPLHRKFQHNWNMFIQRHLIFGPYKYPKPSHPIKRKPKPKHRQPPRCPAKNNTVVNNNTSGATTQIPSLSPTSTSNKITESPGVTSLTQNATTIYVKENNTDSPAVTPSPQPSPALPDTTAAPPTSSPPLPEPTAAPLTSSPPLPEPTAAPPTSSPPLPEPTAAPPTSSPPLPEPTAAPSTSSLTTPAPQPSPVPLNNTAAPNTTPNPSPTTPAPETSQTTTAPTTQTTTPATTQNTTVEQKTSPSSQNTNSKFWQYIYDIIKYISGTTPKK